MTRAHRRRLLKLADLLDTVPIRKFDLGQWHNGQTDCETVGCAVGWATTIPAFHRSGLLLDRHLVPTFTPNYRGFTPTYRGYSAAREFFGLTDDEATLLFSPSEYPAGTGTRPTTVAKRIRKLAAA